MRSTIDAIMKKRLEKSRRKGSGEAAMQVE
jgi:hypothetical protein